MKRKILLFGFVLAIAFVACTKKSAVDTSVPSIEPYHGIFIVNEGNFTGGNASLSYYDMDADTVGNHMFFKANGVPLGDVAQSLTLIDGSLYIMVNNSRYIYKVDAQTILYQEQIQGFASPRFMLPLDDDKAYVTDLAAPGFWKMNLKTNEKSFVTTGKSTECMIKLNNEVFVANWSKAYVNAPNNTLQVIDCDRDTIVAEIEVATEPNSMVLDKYNRIWLVCSGGWEAPFEPAIFCVDPVTRSVVKRYDFPEGSYPSCLAVDGAGETIYYMNGGYSTLDIYKMSIYASQLPDTPFIASDGKWFYSLKVNPIDGDIYVTDAKDCTRNGDLLRYSSSGVLKSTVELGMIPGYMLFN